MLCSCGKVAARLTVRKATANQGRQFYSCAERECDFFHWADEPHAAERVAAAGGQPPQPGAAMVEVEVVAEGQAEVRVRGKAGEALRQALVAAGTGAAGGRLPLGKVGALVAGLARLSPKAKVRSPPPPVLALLQAPQEQHKESAERLADQLRTLEPRLFPFQAEGAARAVLLGGRAFFGDEMGLGKTVQALTVLRHLPERRPALIVCPKSMRECWRAELATWEVATGAEVCVVASAKDRVDGAAAVVVISYEQAQKHVAALQQRQFRSFVFDESHMLKNGSAKRTRALAPLVEAAGPGATVLLLTGTPALNRPIELFAQLSLLGALGGLTLAQFGGRYCRPSRNRFSGAIEYKGAECLTELQLLLERTCLIRRCKSDVLGQLPSKLRAKVWLEEDVLGFQMPVVVDLESPESRNLFARTAELKAAPVIEYLTDLMERDEETPFLLFAHHQSMMDALDDFLTARGCGHIRIDGATGRRGELVQRFQQDPACRVALLSITAAGAGITLTRASLVLFAELYWNPGWLLQCEDRAHRIGQRSSVNVRYLLLRDSPDEDIWRLLDRKMQVLSQALGDDAGALLAEVADEPSSAPLSLSPASAAARPPLGLRQTLLSFAHAAPPVQPGTVALSVKSNAFPERPAQAGPGSSFAALLPGLGLAAEQAAAVVCRGERRQLSDAIGAELEGAMVYVQLRDTSAVPSPLPSPVRSQTLSPAQRASLRSLNVIDLSGDDGDATPQPRAAVSPNSGSGTKRPRPTTPCRYGSSCYRKNPQHFAEFSHPHLE